MFDEQTTNPDDIDLEGLNINKNSAEEIRPPENLAPSLVNVGIKSNIASTDTSPSSAESAPAEGASTEGTEGASTKGTEGASTKGTEGASAPEKSLWWQKLQFWKGGRKSKKNNKKKRGGSKKNKSNKKRRSGKKRSNKKR